MKITVNKIKKDSTPILDKLDLGTLIESNNGGYFVVTSSININKDVKSDYKALIYIGGLTTKYPFVADDTTSKVKQGIYKKVHGKVKEMHIVVE